MTPARRTALTVAEMQDARDEAEHRRTAALRDHGQTLDEAGADNRRTTALALAFRRDLSTEEALLALAASPAGLTVDQALAFAASVPTMDDEVERRVQ